MSYAFYANHPIIDLFGSLIDGADDEPRSYGARCEGGPCGPNARFGRHHHRGHHRGGQRCPEKSDAFVPAADIYSTDATYKVYLSLPSADKESIELTYDPNTRELAVSGTLVRPSEFAGLDEEALKTVLIQGERKTGKFERKLKIPKDEGERILFEEAVAKFDNGVLELTLPKVEKEGPKTIVID
jgi:HSP20 family molecular chaperone IbpA